MSSSLTGPSNLDSPKQRRIASVFVILVFAMKLIDLKDKDVVNFETALSTGLASGGGLYMPYTIPKFSEHEKRELVGASFRNVAEKTISKWLEDEIPQEDLSRIVERAFNFDIPIVDVGDMKVLELFHGPTFAFKDVAAQFLASCIEYYVKKRNSPTNIVVATSGDTGGAIAHAFGGLGDIRVFVLYPKNGVSALQRAQLTRCKSNVEPIEIDGSFDDCQSLVKRAINDSSLGLNISSANSINIGRLLPQITYYVYAAIHLGEYEAVIPTGNLGNATAALMALKMHLGPTHITLANNANNAIEIYEKTGKYSPKKSIKTLSNAMDVGNPNNFPRFKEILKRDITEFRKLVDVYSVNDEMTSGTIKKVSKQYNYLLDPHTAVAWHAAELSKSNLPKVVVSTASPMKFANEIEAVTGIQVDTMLITQSLEESMIKFASLEKDYESFRQFLVVHAL